MFDKFDGTINRIKVTKHHSRGCLETHYMTLVTLFKYIILYCNTILTSLVLK